MLRFKNSVPDRFFSHGFFLFFFFFWSRRWGLFPAPVKKEFYMKTLWTGRSSLIKASGSEALSEFIARLCAELTLSLQKTPRLERAPVRISSSARICNWLSPCRRSSITPGLFTRTKVQVKSHSDATESRSINLSIELKKKEKKEKSVVGRPRAPRGSAVMRPFFLAPSFFLNSKLSQFFNLFTFNTGKKTKLRTYNLEAKMVLWTRFVLVVVVGGGGHLGNSFPW